MDELDEEKYPAGCLVEFKDITYQHRELLIKLLSKEYSYMYEVLYKVLEDDAAVLELLDIFADRRLRFPSRKKIYKTLEKIKIYIYAKNHNNTDDSITVLAKQYKKRPSQIRTILSRIDELLNSNYKDLQNTD